MPVVLLIILVLYKRLLVRGLRQFPNIFFGAIYHIRDYLGSTNFDEHFFLWCMHITKFQFLIRLAIKRKREVWKRF